MDQLALKQKEFNLLRKLIYEKTGINLDAQKKDMVHGRLSKRLRKNGLNSFGEYYQLLNSNSGREEFKSFIDVISTHKTDFFRENRHFELLENQLLPELTAEKIRNGNRKIRIWCAASSTGEEAYTLAIVLARLNLINSTDWDTKILATDISSGVVRQASMGIYNPARVAPVPPADLESYFSRTPDGDYKVSNSLRRLITFGCLNLLDESYHFRGPFDFIFCRNVMIYFDPPTREKIANRMYRYLAPGGYLFIAHSETLSSFTHEYKYIQPAVYRKGDTWR